MQFSPLAFIELFVVMAFLIAWGILELVARRLDRKREQAPLAQECQLSPARVSDRPTSLDKLPHSTERGTELD